MMEQIQTETQTPLEKLDAQTMWFIQMYNSGLITLPEFADAICKLEPAIKEAAVPGVIDPSTGLRL
jgi:hypothetical protein